MEKNFEAGIPEDVDFHGMKTLLQQVEQSIVCDSLMLWNNIICDGMETKTKKSQAF